MSLHKFVVIHGGKIIKAREGYMIEVREVQILPGDGTVKAPGCGKCDECIDGLDCGNES